MGNKYQLTITRPSGNDTGLIRGLVKRGLKKKINDLVEQAFPNVEQVGFYDFDKKVKIGLLEMAGGEFCGNATRSTAYLLLNGEIGEISMKVSGISKVLTAGVKKKNTAFTQVPIITDFSAIQQLAKDVVLVEIEGITHLITQKPENLPKEKLKIEGKKLLKTYDLLQSRKCAGVMYLSKDGTKLVMDPIVWIRDVATLYYETACASGATAVGVWEAYKSKKNKTSIKILQPSGQLLTATVTKNATRFTDAIIEGPISILEKEKEINL